MSERQWDSGRVTVPSHDGGGLSDAELSWLCTETLKTRFPSFREAPIRAQFYPYIGLTHTIRKRDGVWVLRISDHCRRAPRAVLEAIVVILACKILRKRPPRDLLRAYDYFRLHDTTELALHTRRRVRGRKVIDESEGQHHSLPAIFAELNRTYFNDQIAVERIGWSSQRSWSRLGHFDNVHQTITISPVLDSPKVPQSVVSYIVYHEMLHAVFDVEKEGRRRRYHPLQFRKAERAFPDYRSSELFLRNYCRARGRG
jgi:hypothetical protein